MLIVSISSFRFSWLRLGRRDGESTFFPRKEMPLTAKSMKIIARETAALKLIAFRKYPVRRKHGVVCGVLKIIALERSLNFLSGWIVLSLVSSCSIVIIIGF